MAFAFYKEKGGSNYSFGQQYIRQGELFPEKHLFFFSRRDWQEEWKYMTKLVIYQWYRYLIQSKLGMSKIWAGSSQWNRIIQLMDFCPNPCCGSKASLDGRANPSSWGCTYVASFALMQPHLHTLTCMCMRIHAHTHTHNVTSHLWAMMLANTRASLTTSGRVSACDGALLALPTQDPGCNPGAPEKGGMWSSLTPLD